MPDSDLAEYQRALKLWERMQAMEMDALQQSNLLRRIGDGCLEIIERKNDPEVCRKAIDAYEKALQFYAPDRYPAVRARILRGLGSAYSSLADFAERQGSLAKAISCWEEALGFFDATSFPEDHARIQNELCEAYRKLAELERRGIPFAVVGGRDLFTSPETNALWSILRLLVDEKADMDGVG